MRENGGDLLIVAHAGVIRGLLCALSGTDIDRQFDFYIPYLGLTQLRQESPGEDPVPVRIGCRPVEYLQADVAERIWKKCAVGAELKAHMIKVAETALELIGCDPTAAREDRLPVIVMAGAAKHTVIAPEKIVEVGETDPDMWQVAGVLVDTIVEGEEKWQI